MYQPHLSHPAGSAVALCRVTYRMTDQMGMVYYGNYMELFEMGRAELMRSTGFSYREMESDGYMLPVRSVQCDYIIAARYDDLLEIDTHVTKLTRARIHFGYEIRRNADAEVLARGETQHVFLSPEGKLRRVDPKWLERLGQIENSRVKED